MVLGIDVAMVLCARNEERRFGLRFNCELRAESRRLATRVEVVVNATVGEKER